MSTGAVDLRGATVAVTGATGFIGRYIVRTLLDRGARVVGVVRNPDRVPELRAAGVELHRADLAQPDRLAAGFAGADAVVSNAALLALGPRRWEEYRRANVAGTENVFDAVRAAGVRRVVQISSVAVYRGHAQPRVREDHPQLAESDAAGWLANRYGISKALSEQLAWRLASEYGLALTTLRPCAVYGAFDPTFSRLFVRLASLPVTVMPAAAHVPVVYAGDVAEAVALALERPIAIGRAYNVTGEDLPLWDVYRAWGMAGGRTAWLTLPVPFPVRWVYDNTRAETELGWRNRPLVDGFRETIALEGGR